MYDMKKDWKKKKLEEILQLEYGKPFSYFWTVDIK